MRAYATLLEKAAKQEPTELRYHDLARIYLSLGDGAAAAHACERAASLGGDERNIEAVIRMGDQGAYSPEVRLTRARVLIEHGFINSVVIAQLTRAAAEAGDESLTRSLMDYERFYRCGAYEAAKELPYRRLIEIFNASPSIYQDPPNRAIRNAARYNSIIRDRSKPELEVLRQVLTKCARDYIEEMRGVTGDPHPFLASIPSGFVIQAWAVISGPEGHHRPHIHHRAWASGVLYLAVPECVEDSKSRIGWLRVGPPNDMRCSGPAWEERWVKPYQGLVVLMPAFFWHETSPMNRTEERVCVAFDIVPAKYGVSEASSTGIETVP